MEEKIFFQSGDGTPLCGIWHVSTEDSKNAAVILAHGITVDKNEDGVFSDLADNLVSNGFSVLRFDFRGHGESGGKPIDLTIEGELKDLKAAYLWMEKRVPGKPMGILGASFGGGIAVLFASRQPKMLTSLCLWNPVLNYNHTFLHPYLPWIRERKANMKSEIENQGWTTLGSRKYVIGKKLVDEMKILRPYEELKRLKLPICIVHGDEDRHVPYEDSAMYVGDAWKGSLTTIHGSEHGFHDEPYREQAIKRTVDFFVRNLAD